MEQHCHPFYGSNLVIKKIPCVCDWKMSLSALKVSFMCFLLYCFSFCNDIPLLITVLILCELISIIFCESVEVKVWTVMASFLNVGQAVSLLVMTARYTNFSHTFLKGYQSRAYLCLHSFVWYLFMYAATVDKTRHDYCVTFSLY